MDISFLVDRFCYIKLGDGKEYHCLKFDNLHHCDHVLKTAGIMTEDLIETFFLFSINNLGEEYKNGLVFLLDDDAPMKVLAVTNEEMATLRSRGYLSYSKKTQDILKFLRQHLNSSSEAPSKPPAREKPNQAVAMEGVQTIAKVNDTIVPPSELTLASTSNVKPQSEPNYSLANIDEVISSQKAAEADTEDKMEVDSKTDDEAITKASTSEPTLASTPDNKPETDPNTSQHAAENDLEDRMDVDPKTTDEQATEASAAQKKPAGRPKKGSANKKNSHKPGKKSPPSASIASKTSDDSIGCETEKGSQEPQETSPPKQESSKKAASRSSHTSKKSASNNDLITPLVKNSMKSSTKASRESTPEEEEVIWDDPITFSDLKKDFEQAGFRFTGKVYALPNKHPSVCKDAKLGRDYFATVADFRKHLCAFGMDDCKDWDAETRENIHDWVRYHIVDRKGKLPRLKPAKTYYIWKTLIQIGFVYRDKPCLGPRYCFPGEGGLEFDSEAACVEHISRYGFPDNCDFSSVTDIERTRIQMMVAEAVRVNTFQPIDPDWDLNVSTYGRRTSTLKRRHTPSPQERIHSVTKKLEYSNSAKRAKRQRATPVSKAPKTPPQTMETSQSIDTPIHIPTTVTLSPEPSFALPEFGGTDKERLRACLNALKLHHSIGLLRFDPDGTSSLRANLARVENFLTGVFKKRSQDFYLHDDEDDTASAALYVCGEPGVGKTTGVMYCCDKLKEEEAVHGFDVRIIKVTANDLKDSNDLHDAMASALKTTASKKTIISKLKVKQFAGKNKPVFLVFLVDEIDMMLSGSDIVHPHRKSELVIMELLEFANNAELNFALIGLANSTGDDKYGKLHQLGKFQEVVTFSPYSAMDLKRILEVRVGHSVIPESVLETIAKKVESSSGDARKALDVAARAVTDCLHQTPDDAMTYGTLVKNLDVMKVFQSFEKNYKEIMEGQPTAGKVVMCIASVFAERNRSVTFDELYELANDVLNATGRLDDMLQSEDFNIMVSILVDSGLLRTSAAPKKRGKKKSNEMNAKASSLVELDMPVGDVCALLGAEMNIPFYKIIRERAERRVK